MNTFSLVPRLLNSSMPPGIVAVAFGDGDDPVDFVRVSPRLPGGAARREAVRRRLPAESTLAKKNALFWTSGPPTLTPPCRSLNSPTFVCVGGERRWNLGDQTFASAEEVAGPVEPVGPALGDRVDAAAREAALPHVVRRDDELNLAEGVEG